MITARSISHSNRALIVAYAAFLAVLVNGLITPAFSKEGIPGRRVGGGTRVSQVNKVILFGVLSKPNARVFFH